MKTIILAFILSFSNGQYTGGIVQPGDWDTIAECKEKVMEAQRNLASQGVTTKGGCFEVSVPADPKKT